MDNKFESFYGGFEKKELLKLRKQIGYLLKKRTIKDDLHSIYTYFLKNNEKQYLVSQIGKDFSSFFRYFDIKSLSFDFDGGLIINQAMSLRYNSDLESISAFCLIHFYLVIFVCKSNFDRFSISNDSYIFDAYKDPAFYTFVYRGQSNFDWGLSPNLYRYLGQEHINLKVIEDYYQKSGLDAKYQQIFHQRNRLPNGKGKTAGYLNYERMAFFQHACSLSPFIDFSFSQDIAKVFASQSLPYSKKDGSLYCLACLNNGASGRFTNVFFNDSDSFELNGLDVYFYDKVSPVDFGFNDLPIMLLSFNDLKFNASIYTEETNDRMRYQSGVFLYIEKGIILGNILLTKYIDDLTVFKFKVLPEDKKKIINDSFKGICYEPDMLMDPYHYFGTNDK